MFILKEDKFKLKYKTDKRGRPLTTEVDEEDMKRYYDLEEEKEEENDEVESEEEEEIEEEIEEVTKGKIDEATRKKLRSQEIDYARGEGNLAEDTSSSEDEEDSEASEGEVDEGEVTIEWGELDKDAERTEDATRRLAVCNMDWDRVRAVDLMVLLNSFVGRGEGGIKEVVIYVSEFGKERMKEEEREGPRELREGGGIKREEGEGDEEEEEENGEEDEEGNVYQREMLRRYQLNRLKYFYAVVEFDGVEAADKVYKECDGMEYESSGARLDLRFVPDDMSFEGEEVKERCSEMPAEGKYRPRFFTTTALQQVKVDLTWDEDDVGRREVQEAIWGGKGKTKGGGRVEEDDLKMYLASESESEEEEEGDAAGGDGEEDKKLDAIAKYRKLLEGLEEKGRKEKEGDVEMEVTWGVGLKEEVEKKVKKKLEEEEKKGRTPWEEMLDKRKEKRMNRKKEKKGGGEGDEEDKPFSDDEIGEDLKGDEWFESELRENEIFKGDKGKGKVGGKKRKGNDVEVDGDEEEKKRREELELLLMEGKEEDGGKRHWSLKKILMEEKEEGKGRKRRRLLKKKKKMAGGEVDTGDGDGFEVDVKDERFSALWNSHHFNVDPSEPNFKKTKGMEKIIQEKQRRRKEGGDGGNKVVVEPEENKMEHNKQKEFSSKSKKSSAELNFLVKSIKRKTENLEKIKKGKKIK